MMSAAPVRWRSVSRKVSSLMLTERKEGEKKRGGKKGREGGAQRLDELLNFHRCCSGNSTTRQRAERFHSKKRRREKKKKGGRGWCRKRFPRYSVAMLFEHNLPGDGFLVGTKKERGGEKGGKGGEKGGVKGAAPSSPATLRRHKKRGSAARGPEGKKKEDALFSP